MCVCVCVCRYGTEKKERGQRGQDKINEKLARLDRPTHPKKFPHKNCT